MPLTLPYPGFLRHPIPGGGSKWPAPLSGFRTSEITKMQTSFLKCDFFSTISIIKPKFKNIWLRPWLHRDVQKNVRLMTSRWRHASCWTSNSHNFVKNDPILIIFSLKCQIWSIFFKMVSHDTFWTFFETSSFLVGCRRGAAGGPPGCADKNFFGYHVRNWNLGKVTKFGYHTITGFHMPEPNVVLRVTLTPPRGW